jgi:carbon-monoxide dehydrogenase small subunit
MKLPITVTINGQKREFDVWPHHTLLHVLRDDLGLTGTKECCSAGECGACTILLDGEAVNSCIVLAAEAEGAEITTIEGLGKPGALDPLQSAFVEEGAVQCGFCIPGMVMAARYLLNDNPNPTTAEIQEGLVGNLCRCAGYSRIIAAVQKAGGQES